MVILHAVDLLVRCLQIVVFYSLLSAADSKSLWNIHDISSEIFYSRLEMLWFDDAMLSTNISDVSCVIEDLLGVDTDKQCLRMDHDYNSTRDVSFQLNYSSLHSQHHHLIIMWHRVLFIIRITPIVQTSVDTKIAKLAFTSLWTRTKYRIKSIR